MSRTPGWKEERTAPESIVSVARSWVDHGLMHGDGILAPTFIEEVGTASAENTRTAALDRWMRQNPDRAANWLSEVFHRPAGGGFKRCRREVPLSGGGDRPDLLVEFDHGSHAIIEAKWGSIPDDNQLLRYREALLAAGEPVLQPSVALLAPHRWPLPLAAAEDLVSVSWSSVLSHMAAEDHATIEGDLRRTISRQGAIEVAVDEALRDGGEPLKQLTQLLTWLEDLQLIQPTETTKRLSASFCALARTTVTLGIADTISSRQARPVLEAATGAIGGDVTADIGLVKSTLGNDRPLASAPGAVLRPALRVRCDHKHRLTLEVGSHLMPYIQGKKARASWLKESCPQGEDVLWD